jgi:hypothetical protein
MGSPKTQAAKWREELAQQAYQEIERKRLEKAAKTEDAFMKNDAPRRQDVVLKPINDVTSITGCIRRTYENIPEGGEEMPMRSITGSSRRTYSAIMKFETNPTIIKNIQYPDINRHSRRNHTQEPIEANITGGIFWKTSVESSVMCDKITCQQKSVSSIERNKEWEEALQLQIKEKEAMRLIQKDNIDREDKLRLVSQNVEQFNTVANDKWTRAKPQGYTEGTKINDLPRYKNKSEDMTVIEVYTGKSMIPISTHAKLTMFKGLNDEKNVVEEDPKLIEENLTVKLHPKNLDTLSNRLNKTNVNQKTTKSTKPSPANILMEVKNVMKTIHKPLNVIVHPKVSLDDIQKATNISNTKVNHVKEKKSVAKPNIKQIDHAMIRLGIPLDPIAVNQDQKASISKDQKVNIIAQHVQARNTKHVLNNDYPNPINPSKTVTANLPIENYAKYTSYNDMKHSIVMIKGKRNVINTMRQLERSVNTT